MAARCTRQATSGVPGLGCRTRDGHSGGISEVRGAVRCSSTAIQGCLELGHSVMKAIIKKTMGSLAFGAVLLGVLAAACPSQAASFDSTSLAISRLLPTWATVGRAAPPLSILSQVNAARYGPGVLRALESAGPADTVAVIVRLRDQLGLNLAGAEWGGGDEARVRAVSTLRSHADASQRATRAYLAGAKAGGLVEEFSPFWIFNGLAVRAHTSVIKHLAADPSVELIELDLWRQWVDSAGPVGSGAFLKEDGVEWGISRVRADEVWASLLISGTGAVVAGMDTGVDWLHPVLQSNYRGFSPHGPANHLFNWFDATGGGALYPVDGHGHGTHTLGTAVGRGGVGVAPGARWIGVKVLNDQGYGYDSWIHAGFQWLLAPGGDATRIPDTVNCSWGNRNGSLTVFQPDLQMLRAAGIFAVFSNGNSGPAERTVESPASLPEAFAVGAIDSWERVASFSSRGPSPWGEVRPHVVAPGVSIWSSLPGGTYGLKDGTSNAAPHVSGVAALLRSVQPTLTVTQTAYLITSTAVPMDELIPNNDTGWGLVDAFAAVVGLTHPGFLSGTVRRADDGAAVSGAHVVAVSTSQGSRGSAVTGVAGSYDLSLGPGFYDVSVSAFGFYPSAAAVAVITDATTVKDFALETKPTGTVRGEITDASTSQPVTATVSALGTPVWSTGSSYTVELPAGDYVIEARRVGFRVVTRTVSIGVGEAVSLDFSLTSAPSVLLVDSGAWYYDSQAHYYSEALDDLAYTYDEWVIRSVEEDVPQVSDLGPYDVVIWSSPQDAPGYIGAQDTITDYLTLGGRLLLSGQDVGYLDGGGAGFLYYSYYPEFLKARLVRDSSGIHELSGTEHDLYSGISITISGPGGANNQQFPDEIGILDPDSAVSVLSYKDAGCGGMRVGTCLDYRVIYLPFGFEAINSRTSREVILQRALDWLADEPARFGLEVLPETSTRVGAAGEVVTHALRIRNIGQLGAGDLASLQVEGAKWTTELSTPSLHLASCASSTVVVTATVPLTAAWDARDVVTVHARSTLSPAVGATAVITSKAPAPVLLVDDDRWYDQESKYRTALEHSGVPFDYWSTRLVQGSWQEGGSPGLRILERYPIVVWFTGYDWYAPVTAEEESSLISYLRDGGRLFLSSQDFLYYHSSGPLSRDYMGVLRYTEDATPTLASGVREDPVGDGLGPYSLSYPFANMADAVEPAPGTSVVFRDEHRRPIALLRRDDAYATEFMAFPFEALPEDERSTVMSQSVGWLSWLGGSTFQAGSGPASPGSTATYALSIRNDGPQTATAEVSITVPSGLAVDASSLPDLAQFDQGDGRIEWKTSVGSTSAVTMTYGATIEVGTPAGSLLNSTAAIRHAEHNIAFRRSASVGVGLPDLSESVLQILPTSTARPLVTDTLSARNDGSADAADASVEIVLPAGTDAVSASLSWAGGGTASIEGGVVRWSGSVYSGAWLTVGCQVTLPATSRPLTLYGVAFVDDGSGEAPLERSAWVVAVPHRVFLPRVYKDGVQP